MDDIFFSIGDATSLMLRDSCTYLTHRVCNKFSVVEFMERLWILVSFLTDDSLHYHSYLLISLVFY